MKNLNPKSIIIVALVLFLILAVSSYIGHIYFTPLRALEEFPDKVFFNVKNYSDVEPLSAIRHKGSEYLLTYSMSNNAGEAKVVLALFKRNLWGWVGPTNLTHIDVTKIGKDYYFGRGYKRGKEWINYYGYVHSDEAKVIKITLANDESFKVPIKNRSFITLFKITDNNGVYYPKKVVVLNAQGEELIQ